MRDIVEAEEKLNTDEKESTGLGIDKVNRWETLLDNPVVNVLMSIATIAVYVICVPADLAFGIPFRCRKRILRNAREDDEWIIIMGAGYRRLKNRVSDAIVQFGRRPDLKFFLSGTVREDYSEPGFMRQLLLDAGVSESNMVLDGAGDSTRETLKNAGEHGITKAAIVTSDFHVRRCVNTAVRMKLDYVGIRVGFAANPIRWRYWLREKAAIYRDNFV